MPLTLISATPSPYARKVRIALAEKGIAFTLQTEVPWNSTTQTPQYNPLEKLPVLILENANEQQQQQQNGNPARKHPAAVYESRHILEYLEAKYPSPPLLPDAAHVDDRLFAKNVEVVADGICDALVLLFFEKQREPDKQSKEWQSRQQRKVDGGMACLAEWVGDGKLDGRSKFLVEGGFGLADIAAGSLLGYISLRWPDYGWKEKWPGLKWYWEGLEERESFKGSRPSAQKIDDKIV